MNANLIDITDSTDDDDYGNIQTKINIEPKTDKKNKKGKKNKLVKTVEIKDPHIENLEYKYKKQIEPEKVIIDRTNIVKENDEIVLIQKDNIRVDNKNVMKFIKFCIDTRLFDDTYYDFGNAFSIMATKLPSTFDLISLDGKNIDKLLFIEFFTNEINFDGDIEDVYNEIDKDKKDKITWEDFIEFFIPFVRYVTI